MAANENENFWNVPNDITASKWDRFWFWLYAMIPAFLLPMAIYLLIKTSLGGHIGIDPIWTIVAGLINCVLLHTYAIIRRKWLERFGFLAMMYVKDCRRAKDNP